MNEDEQFPDGSEYSTETSTETPQPDNNEFYSADDEDYADELPEEEEDAEPVAEVAQTAARPTYAPLNRPASPALERLQATLDGETFSDILTVMREETNYALQTFATVSGRFNQVSQQEQDYAGRYGAFMGEVLASMPAEQRGNPDAVDQAATIALFHRAKANGRSVIEEINDYADSRNKPHAAQPTTKRPTLTPSGRMPSGGQGARPAGSGSRRAGESLATQYMKSLGFDDAEARQLARIKD